MITNLLDIIGDKPNTIDLSGSMSLYFYAPLTNITLINHNEISQKVLIRFTYNTRRYKKWVSLSALKRKMDVVYAHRKTLNSILNK
jgi:hypothetical protein